MTAPTDFLPRRIAELADVIGIAAALKLVELRGGGQLYVPMPKYLKPNHWLLAEIGHEALVKLSQYYGGEMLEIDRCQGIVTKLKHQAIMTALDDGQSVWSQAQAHNMTCRGIRKIRQQRQQHAADLTADIFDVFKS